MRASQTLYFNPGQEDGLEEEGVRQVPQAAATAMGGVGAQQEAEVAINSHVILFSGTRTRFLVKLQIAVLDSVI